MLMPDTVAGELVFPATSVQIPAADCPCPSVVMTLGAVQPASPEPDRLSVPAKLTVTSVLFQPFALGLGEREEATVGGVRSIRMLPDEALELFPALSRHEPITV
jgi:hypothetical protein